MPDDTRDKLISAATAGIDALLEALPIVAPPPDPVPSPPPIPPPPPPTPVIVPTGHPRIMLGSQAPRLKASLTSPAGARWKGIVDRWLGGEDIWGLDAWNGALLSALGGDPRYAAKAVAVIDAQVAAAESAIAQGMVPAVAGDSYLQVGEMIGDLALVYDWCSTTLTSSQRSRWIAYANQAVSNVWNPTTASWGGKTATWTGWATDDPGDNYYYSFTRATMLFGLATQGENPQAASWIAKLNERIVGRLIPYMTAEQADGGSREGTGYGVALRNLFELYALWQWSTGESLADLTPHTRASILTAISQIVPTLDRKLPIGDQSRDSTAALFDYERSYMLELVALYPAAPESARALALLAASSVPSMQSGFMLGYDVVFAPSVAPVPLDLPLVRYASGIGQINARSSWAKTATMLSMIAGPYTQSHAHQDQGSLMIYKGGWMAYDAVIASKGGVVQSGSLVGLPEAHSLVRLGAVGSCPQKSGTTSRVFTLRSGPGYMFASIDLTAAYAGNPNVVLVARQILWLQPDVFIVQDHVVTTPSLAQTWQLVVPTQPVIAGAVATVTAGGHTMTVTRVAPAAGQWTTFDFRTNSDFTGAWRLDCAQPGGDRTQPGGDRTYVTVIALDGAVSPVTPTVVFAGVGVTFTLGGKVIGISTGIDAT